MGLGGCGEFEGKGLWGCRFQIYILLCANAGFRVQG